MKKTQAGLVTLASVLIIALFGNTSAFALSLPGITPSGEPSFTDFVRIQLSPHGTLRAWGTNSLFFLDTGDDLITGSRGRFRMKAFFDDDGNFLEGQLLLNGKMNELGIDVRQDLVTADLTSANLTDDPTLWGFNTTNIWCAPELGLNCTMNESVYLTLNDAFSGEFGRNFRTTGFSITTVPVPAAVWLFGSSLGLLGWVRRRSIKATA